MQNHVWRTIVFGAEFVYMAFELLAVRLLSPAVGTTLEVWSAVIGCVLAASALGNLAGGRLSKRPGALFGALSAASVLCAAAPFLQGEALAAFSGQPLAATALGASLCMFFLPSCAAGMVPPLAMHRVMTASGEAGEAAGERAGGVYAAATLGGLAGTFAAGFWLIPAFGTVSLVFGCAAAYAALATAAAAAQSALSGGAGRARFAVAAAAAAAVAAVCVGCAAAMVNGSAADGEGRADFWQDTKYGRVHVWDTSLDGRGDVRLMGIDGGFESGMCLGAGREAEPVFDYMELVAQGTAARLGDDGAATVLGGAAYCLPKLFLADTPACVTVAEIDPGVTGIARTWFALDEAEAAAPGRLDVIEADGRIALGGLRGSGQGVVVNDTFGGLTPARTLATAEAMEAVKAALADGGVYAVNMIGTPGSGGFLDYECATLSAAFAHVRVFAAGEAPGEYGNYVAFASDGDLSGLRPEARFAEVEAPESPDGRVLTDDWCPVERLAGR